MPTGTEGFSVDCAEEKLQEKVLLPGFIVLDHMSS